ncbi:hypothetical protein [Lacihabitans lacunae]|uniref:Uncharacterized protein n=1 Tax=Lacihabitans lacunae TaxID=1028214 RepID=A0ABV7YZG6_9BACT
MLNKIMGILRGKAEIPVCSSLLNNSMGVTVLVNKVNKNASRSLAYKYVICIFLDHFY